MVKEEIDKIILFITLQFYFRLSSFNLLMAGNELKLIITTIFIIRDETRRNYNIVNKINWLKLTKIVFRIFSQSTNGKGKKFKLNLRHPLRNDIYTKLCNIWLKGIDKIILSLPFSLFLFLSSMARNKSSLVCYVISIKFTDVNLKSIRYLYLHFHNFD